MKTELANGNALVVGARSSLSNSIKLQLDDPNTDGDEPSWRRGQHIFMVDKVLTDARGPRRRFGLVLEVRKGQCVLVRQDP